MMCTNIFRQQLLKTETSHRFFQNSFGSFENKKVKMMDEQT